MWVAGCNGCLCGLCKKGCPDPVCEAQMLLKPCEEVCVVLMSLSIAMAKVDHAGAKEVDTFPRCFIGFVIAKLILQLHKALVNHVLLGMTFHLGNGDGLNPLGCNILIVE